MIKNQRPLVDAILDALFFLENSGDDQVDPDSAVRCMENIGASLLALDESDQLALRSELETIADEQEDERFETFIRETPDAIGLASPKSARPSGT